MHGATNNYMHAWEYTAQELASKAAAQIALQLAARNSTRTYTYVTSHAATSILVIYNLH